MTIEQTIEIPASRKVFFEFLAPEEIPAGLTKVELKLTPVIDKPKSKNQNERATPHTDALLGILSGIGEINPDEIRMERLAKHLK